MKIRTIVIMLAFLLVAASCDKKSTIKISGSPGVSFKSKKSSLAPLFTYANKEYKLRSGKIMKMIKWDNTVAKRSI